MALRFMMEEDDESYVYLDGKARAAAASSRPRPSTCPACWPSACSSKVDTVVLTSATLAVAGGFDYLAEAAGPAQSRARWWCPGHFDYQKQALLYVPQHLPEPRSPAFTAGGRRGSGRASSNTAAAAPSCCSPATSRCGWCYDNVSFEIEYPTLLQGTGPRTRAARRVPLHAQLRAVRHLLVLAGRGRAGRAVELRYHR